jgi:hypothetical protein
MADSITATIDDSRLIAVQSPLEASMRRHINDASRETAVAVVTEAKARLRRQLGPNATGLTEAGISSRPAFDGNGYVVLSSRDHPQLSLHTSKRSGRIHTQKVTQSNVPIWVEKGIKKGDPRSHSEPARPFFYVSVLLERGAHERRIQDAIQDATNETGLGD